VRGVDARHVTRDDVTALRREELDLALRAGAESGQCPALPAGHDALAVLDGPDVDGSVRRRRKREQRARYLRLDRGLQLLAAAGQRDQLAAQDTVVAVDGRHDVGELARDLPLAADLARGAPASPTPAD
jgi:hypothetical protein